jgi:DNA-binding NtrC family response regulator
VTVPMTEKRILAIDDDAAFREFLSTVLTDTDCTSMITAGAAAFKEAYAELDPTVVVLDMVMPETDGFELMHWLVEQGYDSRVVLITGFSTRYAKMAETLGTDRGLSDVISLPKPIQLAELRRALDIN